MPCTPKSLLAAATGLSVIKVPSTWTGEIRTWERLWELFTIQKALGTVLVEQFMWKGAEWRHNKTRPWLVRWGYECSEIEADLRTVRAESFHLLSWTAATDLSLHLKFDSLCLRGDHCFFFFTPLSVFLPIILSSKVADEKSWSVLQGKYARVFNESEKPAAFSLHLRSGPPDNGKVEKEVTVRIQKRETHSWKNWFSGFIDRWHLVYVVTVGSLKLSLFSFVCSYPRYDGI